MSHHHDICCVLIHYAPSSIILKIKTLFSSPCNDDDNLLLR